VRAEKKKAGEEREESKICFGVADFTVNLPLM